MRRIFAGLAVVLFVAIARSARADCAASDTTLCLNASRFTASVSWKDANGRTGEGHAIAITADTGYFWFFTSSNIELVVKVLDGRLVNGHRWVFYGALTDVEYTITVIDRLSGESKSYHNPHGRMASQADTSAF